MVTIQQDSDLKLLTQKQNSIIAQIIQSSALTKSERDYVVDKVAGKLITSYDGSVLISYLLNKIKFMKHFNGVRSHQIAKCFSCGNRINLQRYEEIKTCNRVWVCDFCKTTLDHEVYAVVPRRNSNGRTE